MLLAWIKNIVLFILFSSLVFFLLPDEKYRKYMQTAVGFVLAIIVLTPVLSAGGLNDILSFDYYYESVAGAPGNGDVTYYTDVMETMIEDHLRDLFQLDSKVAITFDENYTITAVEYRLDLRYYLSYRGLYSKIIRKLISEFIINCMIINSCSCYIIRKHFISYRI